MGDLPSFTGDHISVIMPLPGIATRPVGVAGTVAVDVGVTIMLFVATPPKGYAEFAAFTLTL
jgi:hypothetical protein